MTLKETEFRMTLLKNEVGELKEETDQLKSDRNAIMI